MSKRAINLSELKRQHRLNPIFHLQTKNDDSSVLSMGMIKQARKSGILNLSGRGLVSGNLIKLKCIKLIFYLWY